MVAVVRCGCMLSVFYKQKTAYEMRISDWRSDVCSSDLTGARVQVNCRECTPKTQPAAPGHLEAALRRSAIGSPGTVDQPEGGGSIKAPIAIFRVDFTLRQIQFRDRKDYSAGSVKWERD